jgi:7-cyano-7-deazaguanine reductase
LIYVPAQELVELKSLKLYLLKFRDMRLTHEALLNTIFEDLINLPKPKYIRIELHANIRGGIMAITYRE